MALGDELETQIIASHAAAEKLIEAVVVEVIQVTDPAPISKYLIAAEASAEYQSVP